MKFLVSAFIIASMVVTASTATAQDAFLLPYKGENRWVSSADAKDLRALVKTARKSKATYFHVQLPKDKRNASIERLIVLRDILEKNLKSGIIIEEVDGVAPDNSLNVMIKPQS